jgi:D-alanine-D-alanine ligase
MRIPYTHSGVLSSALAFDKIHSRSWFLTNDINMAENIVVSKSDNIGGDPMKRPYVVKPLTQGSSIGVEVIFEEDNFNFADYDFPYGDQVVIERYIKGRELQIAVLNGKALGALEIKLLKNRFYDYETKYTEGFAEHLCPAPLPADLYEKVLIESEKIY